MADTLEPERRRRAGWLWGILALVVVAVLVWWAWPQDEEVIFDREVATELEPLPPVAEGPTDNTIVMILDNPSEHVGQPFPSTEVRVADVPTDRGFWVEAEGRRLFAILIDQPREEPKDIQAGQSLRIEGGTLRDASFLDQIEGVPLDANTRGIAEEQDIFLVVDEGEIVMLDVEEARTGADPLETN